MNTINIEHNVQVSTSLSIVDHKKMAGETMLNRKRLKMQRENHLVPTYLCCLTVFNNDFSDYLALRRYRFFSFLFSRLSDPQVESGGLFADGQISLCICCNK